MLVDHFRLDFLRDACCLRVDVFDQRLHGGQSGLSLAIHRRRIFANGSDVWSYNGSAWSPFAAGDLTFDGTFASFTVSALNGCGYAVVDAPLLPGDANGDGRVDINDLTIVLANFGRSTGMTWSTGDFIGDGTVDINDLTIVLANFGQGTGSSAAGLAATPRALRTCADRPRWG